MTVLSERTRLPHRRFQRPLTAASHPWMSESHQPGKRLSGLPFVTADLVKRSDGI